MPRGADFYHASRSHPIQEPPLVWIRPDMHVEFARSRGGFSGRDANAGP
ncbi:hypothetical protein ENSA7_15210 [Enhygromyxa salina]|uniref:Uncharacterized protein n=1 Tax=Enhygromyxa salina TaxID=215803 RepID=A0A2S9YUD7_9BACT|nr:hypothetical protein ENSA7_15210 [Enhygromyxa salina]